MASSVSVLLPNHVDANPTASSNVGKNDKNTLNAIACDTMLQRGNTRPNIRHTRVTDHPLNSSRIITVVAPHFGPALHFSGILTPDFKESALPRREQFRCRFLFCLFSLAAGSLCLFAQQLRSPSTSANSSDNSGYVGNQACAKCHAQIYESYMRTAMANASGPATENLIAGEFTHKLSGVHYKIATENGKVVLTFDRPGDPFVHGEREFLYYIGQGRRGRTYLFSTDGFLFESPVNWYADRHLWDMAPAYGSSPTMPLNLPATTSCMHCHLSGVRAPLAGSDNLYPDPPFFFSGVTCERCHGPGAAHALNGTAPIVNPSKLSPTLRDQVCMQCHLEGNAAIERAGKHIYEFRPGDDLSSFVRYYVLTGNVPPGLRATSQFEALAESGCKKKSGDALTCTTCHDPHQSVSPENRAAYFRVECVSCHGEKFAAKHHKNQPDCTSCHMPVSQSSDVAHTQVTDHRIPRHSQSSAAAAAQPSSSAIPTLIPFLDTPDSSKDTRDLALAWQSIVNSGMTMAQPQTERLLQAALPDSPNDPALLSALAFAAQQRGNLAEAASLYQKTLVLDPDSLEAASNLAAIEANQGHFAEARKLWQSAFERAPAKSEIGMNLARLYCASRQFDDARSTLLRVLRFNPDLPPAKQFLSSLNSPTPSCSF